MIGAENLRDFYKDLHGYILSKIPQPTPLGQRNNNIVHRICWIEIVLTFFILTFYVLLQNTDAPDGQSFTKINIIFYIKFFMLYCLLLQ